MSLFDLSKFQQARINAINKSFKSDEVVMDKKELVGEHKKLTKVLESPSHEDDKEEAKKQKKELDNLLEKGRKSQPIGTIKEFGGRNYIKTADGTWKFHGKGTGAKAQEHMKGTKPNISDKIIMEHHGIPDSYWRTLSSESKNVALTNYKINTSSMPFQEVVDHYEKSGHINGLQSYLNQFKGKKLLVNEGSLKKPQLIEKTLEYCAGPYGRKNDTLDCHFSDGSVAHQSRIKGIAADNDQSKDQILSSYRSELKEALKKDKGDEEGKNVTAVLDKYMNIPGEHDSDDLNEILDEEIEIHDKGVNVIADKKAIQEVENPAAANGIKGGGFFGRKTEQPQNNAIIGKTQSGKRVIEGQDPSARP